MALPKMGTKVQDKVTGFRGTITAEVRYLDRGRRAYMLEGADQSGKPVELWVSQSRIADADAPIPAGSPSDDTEGE